MIPTAGGRTSRRGESGFALLLIFLMAAVAAVMLYMALPRVAFEAQRNKEELLIERGEQYKRAIQLYFRKFKTYPASIDALEHTNNIRFLRRRYADPLTGKDEWRLIHIGPGGVFTDSLTHKPKTNQPQQANLNTFITEGPAIGSTQVGTQPGAAGPPRRPSESGQPQPGVGSNSVAGVTGQPGTDQPPADPNNPTPPGNAQPPVPPAAGVPGMPQAPVSAFPGFPSTPYNPGAPQQTSPTPGMPPQPPGPMSPDGTPLNGAPLGQAGIDPTQGGAGQSAADLLNNLLTRPRPMPGSTGSLSGNGLGSGMGNGLQTGGIAGVASKVERSSIKIYKDFQHYNEWEFIYDYAKDRTGAGRMTAAMGGAAQQQGGQTPNGGMGFGAPGGQMGSGATFGGTPGFGGASAPSAFGGTSPQPSSSSSGSSAGNSGGGGGIGAGLGVVIGSGLSGSSSPPPGGQPQQPPPQAGPLPPPQSTNPPN